MDRCWVLTNTLYGTWLPGKHDGFVGQVLEHRPDEAAEHTRVRHNLIGTPYDAAMPGLEQASREKMKGAPIHLTKDHAAALLEQLQETAHIRKWEILAVAIMYNHFHIVVGVQGEPEPAKVLGDFKCWGTRKLTAMFGAPASQTWWTERGSKRKLKDDAAIAAGRHYVLYDQPDPLLT